MNDSSMGISLKSILWIVILIGIIISLVAALNFIDNSKKYNQYKALNENVINSEYRDRFTNLIRVSSLRDSASIIQQTLESLEEEIPMIDYSEIYLPDSGYYYKITDGRYADDSEIITKIVYLPNHIKKFIAYIDKNPKPGIDSLYSLIKDDSQLDIVFKVGKGYLYVRHSRY
jgi:hypothetical protein